MDGGSPEYTQGFTFEPPQEDITNPDESVM